GQLFKQAAAKHIRRIFLEVRSSNRAAFALYQQHGFIPSGRRPGYYPRPDGSREDALLMEKLC
ncbi:GNAT family N-acetyltransferase, partial [Eikenella sp. Marseille-P7795]